MLCCRSDRATGEIAVLPSNPEKFDNFNILKYISSIAKETKRLKQIVKCQQLRYCTTIIDSKYKVEGRLAIDGNAM